jgi:hypothetical protein
MTARSFETAVFGRRPHPHLPRHLLFRVLAYRLQADVFGDLDSECQRLLDRSVSPEDAGQVRGAIGPLAANFEMLTIPDCAHFPPEERPAELAAALRDHFARCP